MGNHHAHQDLGDQGTHTAEGGKACTVVGLIAHHGSHGTVGNVDAGVAHAAPKQVGCEHENDAHRHGKICRKGLVHQKRCQRHGTAGTQQPGAEFTVFGGFGLVADASHRCVGERVHDTGDQKHGADDACGDAQNIGVEDLQIQACKDEGEVVCHIADHVAHAVPPSKGTDAVGCSHGCSPFGNHKSTMI